MNFNNLFDEIRKFKATHDIYIYMVVAPMAEVYIKF